jgi:hypothetical protein
MGKLSSWLVVSSIALSGCFGTKAGTVCGGNGCVITSGSPVDAAIMAASAGAVFAVTGCTINGCEFPYECNQSSKRCERLRCAEDKPCPSPYNCDMEQHRCW